MKTSFMSLAAALLGLASFSQAHMQMKDPPPFRSKFNKFTTSVDYDMTSPLNAGGSNFPCKGYHKLLGTAQGKPVTEWVPGQSYSMTITGGTPHNGGSCQASVSFDKGSIWTVIHSYIGHCPVMGDSSYQFTLPSDTPAGDMLFAWTWFNQIGNREMYMNCAAITVKGGGKKRRGASNPISSRPNMFVGNVGNGCGTTEGRDLLFPNPGPDGQQGGGDGKQQSGSGGGGGGGGGSNNSSSTHRGTQDQEPASTDGSKSNGGPPPATVGAKPNPSGGGYC
ncbi:Uncharacterized protein TCAP_00638 [Tolypocladium capitatum]|uniref:Extracellular protein n=1 Tax=Tolypocladium capitatum TaxID=45235 RepID=A0A2K3QPJ6_9HYPO|nr:Uncharacterized protein TCAP_00638 [Tolypocladium capitatum]